MPKHKILYITLFPNIGGGETSLFYLIEKLSRKKLKSEVVITSKGQVYSHLKKMGVKTHIINLPGYFLRTFFVPGASPSGIWKLYKLTRQIKPDLIHINQPTLVIYAGLVGKLLKIPVVATAHGFWDRLYFYQDVINNIFIDKIIANSPRLKKALLKRGIISASKVEAILFGIDTKVFKPGSKELAREKLKLPKDKIIITIVGRLDPQKDHLNFFRASEIVAKKIPNASFFVVGSKLGDFSETNYYQKIRNYIKDNPRLDEKIIWGGFIKNMPLVYQASDILVMASVFEGLPLTLLEAASSELPIVATKSGSVDLVVKNGKTGFLVPPKNNKELAEKMIALARDKILRMEFGKEARRLIVKNFTIERYAKRIEHIYASFWK